ncbi:protein phosphatase 1 regulatory subunit 14A-like isoform X1 [Acanthochromis polyacanthus]|uniref:Protein phosphatase 1 regulatory inhibitor subunit 14A n=1 Tax=Acanthochromis polyacanthus TaxID=80966 RepID=A0A3Q1EYU4_9TELE|nr:protein phosphatase 1 regulatory subunit 14A isoform X1 [Acanthochromis polyacanthus]XP_051814001.1 protein phosphatase 1 regulatory subunit 14A-like isoform X1 [Acanthochromis polyacanthus]
MAANRVGRRVNRVCGSPSPSRDSGQNLQRRQARVTVKYNRTELQRRLDVESWTDRGLEQLYRGREEQMPEELNIDELLDLKTVEERTHRLQNILQSCPSSTEVFISELLLKLQGLQKQEDLHNDGIDLPQLHILSTRSQSAHREALH